MFVALRWYDWVSYYTTLSHIEWLLQLTDYEGDVKRENVIHHMVKVSNFPHLKTLKDFDFTFQPQINELQIKNLASLHFMEQAENIIFIGSSGVGKTHLATSLGIESAQSRWRTFRSSIKTLYKIPTFNYWWNWLLTTTRGRC